MAYTTVDNPELYFQTKIYTGTGSSQAHTFDGSENMQPDFLWFKRRTGGAASHALFNVITGVTKLLKANDSRAEVTTSVELTSFDSDGFSLGSGSDAYTNQNSGKTYVAWGWKAGTSFSNDASATSVGSIDSTGSINTDAGFSIITYSGDTSDAPSTVAHGLSQKPEMIFIKRRTLTGQWVVYNKTIGATHNLHLDSTDASSTYQYFFNNTEPTSSVFTVGDDGESNKTSSNYVAYVFHSVKGYSKIGSYTGNGNANGTFVYTGFRPSWILVRNTELSENAWVINDNKRNTFNPNSNTLTPANT